MTVVKAFMNYRNFFGKHKVFGCKFKIFVPKTNRECGVFYKFAPENFVTSRRGYLEFACENRCLMIDVFTGVMVYSIANNNIGIFGLCNVVHFFVHFKVNPVVAVDKAKIFTRSFFKR